MRLLARRLVANNGTDVDSLGNLGYLAHGRYTTEVLMTSLQDTTGALTTSAPYSHFAYYHVHSTAAGYYEFSTENAWYDDEDGEQVDENAELDISISLDITGTFEFKWSMKLVSPTGSPAHPAASMRQVWVAPSTASDRNVASNTKRFVFDHDTTGQYAIYQDFSTSTDPTGSDIVSTHNYTSQTTITEGAENEFVISRDTDDVLHWTINGTEITSFTHTAPVGLIKFFIPQNTSSNYFDMHLKGMEICSSCSFPVNAISFTTDACTFSETCPFVPPLNVPVLLKADSTGDILTLQFDRTEYVHDRTPRGIKMYIDDAASGVTVPADRPPATPSAIVWDQYIPRFDPNFDLDRPYWKDRNTRLSEVLDLQRRREHICTLTNKATANFAGPKASFTAADGLPDEAWTLFGANGGGWELVSGQNVLNAEETALVADQRGTYELHFNIYHQTTKPIAFIVAGQSNARGWLDQGVAGDAHFSGTKQWSYGQYYNGTSWVDWQSTGLIDATLPLHHPDSRYSNAIGFDMQFSHEHGYSDVIFIPCAYGGSGFANNYWNKGDTITVNGVQTPGLYQQMVDKANAFFNAYPDIELAGFLWHQGEADDGNSYDINNYATRFTTMLQHARNDISAMTADTPVIIGAILETSAQPNAAAFNSELASIAANDSSITYVDGLKNLDAFFDGIHFNRDGYNAMGTLYYQAWLAAYESKAVALAFQARVNATGVGPVYISRPASHVTRRAGQSGDQQVRLQLAAGDSVGVQVAIYTAGVGAYEAHAPAGRSMLALKRIV